MEAKFKLIQISKNCKKVYVRKEKYCTFAVNKKNNHDRRN